MQTVAKPHGSDYSDVPCHTVCRYFDPPGRDERKDEHLQHPHQQLTRKREVDLGL